MPLIILDGPEKAGKTTIATEIASKHHGQVRHWGPTDSDVVYMEPLMEDCKAAANGATVIWDRSWAAEAVYSQLLSRGRRLGDDPWLGEWLYGRAVANLGIRVMVLGPSVVELARKRDATDLPVNPAEERATFYGYARQFGWQTVAPEHTRTALKEVASDIWRQACEAADVRAVRPPHWAGPAMASTVYIGEPRSEGQPFPGAWLPFSTPLTMQFARLAPEPLRAGWTNCAECPPQALRHAATIVTCGTAAEKWARYHVAKDGQKLIHLAHPAYAFRYSNAAATAAKRQIENQLRRLGHKEVNQGKA